MGCGKQSFWLQSRCFVAPGQQRKSTVLKPLKKARYALVLGSRVYQQKGLVVAK
jgi:hypothetical protein